jgi:hypothetical protein
VLLSEISSMVFIHEFQSRSMISFKLTRKICANIYKFISFYSTLATAKKKRQSRDANLIRLIATRSRTSRTSRDHVMLTSPCDRGWCGRFTRFITLLRNMHFTMFIVFTRPFSSHMSREYIRRTFLGKK